MNGTIVCGVVGSAAGRTAAQVAGAIAHRLGLRLVLVHAVDLPGRVFGRAHLHRLRATAELSLGLTADELGAEAVEVRIEFGDAADVLAWVAAEEDADLIVLGSRPGGRLRPRLECALGGLLVRETPVPVLIAPPQTAPRSGLRLERRELSAAGV